jgi:hypothetical protein
MIMLKYIQNHPGWNSDLERLRSEIKSKRPYVFPKSYINYLDFLQSIILVTNSYSLTWDAPTTHLFSQTIRWRDRNTPIYVLNPDTLELFGNSTAPVSSDLFADLDLITEPISYCILLPKGLFPTVDNGYLEVLWIDTIYNSSDRTISLISNLNGRKYSQEVYAKTRQITSGGMDSKGILWCANTPYPKPANERRCNTGSAVMDEFDMDVTERIRNLTLQVVLAIECLPNAVEIIEPVARSIGGFGATRQKSTIETWKPRCLKIDRQNYIRSDTRRESSGNRKSPRPHWRKYHWRRVATGMQRTERQWRLIQTTYINS